MSQPPVVLVVEGEPVLRMIALDHLEDAGLSAVEACNAADGMARLEQNPSIKVVWTDIQMPGKDGLSFAMEARQRWAHLDFIFLSGGTTLGDSELPERSVFFAKPYVASTVIEIIRRFLH